MPRTLLMLLNPSYLKPLVAVFLSAVVCSAMALEFGALKVKSGRGEVLSAEVAIQAGPADVLEPGCIRAIAPGRRDLPAATGVMLSWRKGAASPVLEVRTAEIVDQPVLALALAADCGAGHVWREFSVFLKSSSRSRSAGAASGSGWVIMPGESPRSLAKLLYPGQPRTQQHFIQALADANPARAIDASGEAELLAGSVLQMPDWRTLGAPDSAAGAGGPDSVARGSTSPQGKTGEAGQPHPYLATRLPAPVKSVSRSSSRQSETSALAPDFGPDTALSLRLSPSLSMRVEASDKLRETRREMLRLEYRLRASLNEQLSALSARGEQGMHEATAASIAALPSMAPADPGNQLQGSPVVPIEPLVVPAPASLQQAEPASAPKKIPQALPASPPLASTADGGMGWLTYAGLAAVVLMLLVLRVRRRSSVAAAVPTNDSEFPETVVVEHPVRTGGGVDAFFSQPDATSSRSLKTASFAPPDEKTEANPVMELAEIMLSFGRVEGAAETLKEYIDANPKEALQPWVKLLDIYRAGDMRSQFDDLAQKLNRNFNVELQQWNAETPPPESVDPNLSSKAMTLEEMPRICEQIVSRWHSDDCLDYLHQLLRDNRGGQRSGFTLPVVQEILLLIEILVAHEATGRS